MNRRSAILAAMGGMLAAVGLRNATVIGCTPIGMPIVNADPIKIAMRDAYIMLLGSGMLTPSKICELEELDLADAAQPKRDGTKWTINDLRNAQRGS